MTREKGQLSLFGDAPTQYAPATPEEVAERRERLTNLIDEEKGTEVRELVSELFARGELQTLLSVLTDEKKIHGMFDMLREQMNRSDLLVPIDLALAIYAIATDPERKWRAALYIQDQDRFARLMLDAWNAGDLDEAAFLYGISYGDPYKDDWDTIALAGDRAPTEMLQALIDYPWPTKQYLKGIKDWILETIEQRKS